MGTGHAACRPCSFLLDWVRPNRGKEPLISLPIYRMAERGAPRTHGRRRLPAGLASPGSARVTLDEPPSPPRVVLSSSLARTLPREGFDARPGRWALNS